MGRPSRQLQPLLPGQTASLHDDRCVDALGLGAPRTYTSVGCGVRTGAEKRWGSSSPRKDGTTCLSSSRHTFPTMARPRGPEGAWNRKIPITGQL